MANTSVQFNGEAGNIESNVNKTNLFNKSLSEAAKETKYPSIKCLENLIDLWFPVTSTLIFSSSAVDPNNIYVGRWERTAKGKAIVGVDEDDEDFATAGITRGEKTHTLTVAELAAHRHSKIYYADSGKTFGLADTGTSPTSAWALEYAGADNHPGDSLNTGETGGGEPHNNIQPSMTFYIWTRVA